MIEIREETVKRVSSLLAGVKDGAKTAMQNALDRGLSTVRSEAFKEVSKVYAITQKNLRAESNIKLYKYYGDADIQASICYSGFKIPLYRFDVSPKSPSAKGGADKVPVQFGANGENEWRMVTPGAQVKARQMIGSAQTPFINAFIADMGNGHTGMFKRDSAARFSISEFMGSSVAQMIGNGVVREEIEKRAQETVEKRIEAEINRILNGYGGK